MNDSATLKYRASVIMLVIRCLVIACLLLLLWYLSEQAIAESALRDLQIIVAILAGLTLLSWFLAGMTTTSQAQEQAQAAEREAQLRSEQVLAVAGLAAGTAHELATPLSTMTVLLEELQTTAGDGGDLLLLREQLDHCMVVLEKLSKTARVNEVGDSRRVDSADYLRLVFEEWQLLRPDASATLRITGRGQSPMIDVELSLGQAIENLLNNAADAWAKNIEVELDWSNHELLISISDHGPGVPAKTLQQIGKPIVREGGRGMGLGLMLSYAIVSRYRGRIELQNRPRGGTLAQLFLPLRRK